MKTILLALLLTLSIEASEHTREVYSGDLNHDGHKQRVVLEYSGGAHCCSNMFIIQENKALGHRVGFSLSNQDDVTFKDIDKDGTVEMILYDDMYSYFGSLCFACSPGNPPKVSSAVVSFEIHPDFPLAPMSKILDMFLDRFDIKDFVIFGTDANECLELDELGLVVLVGVEG